MSLLLDAARAPGPALGLLHQGLLVREVAAHDSVLRVLPVTDEGPDAIDHALDLFGFPVSVRQGSQAFEDILLLLPSLVKTLLEAPPAFARSESS